MKEYILIFRVGFTERRRLFLGSLILLALICGVLDVLWLNLPWDIQYFQGKMKWIS
jgi:hypothetical protein